MRNDPQRFQLALEALFELGPALSSSVDFAETARDVVARVMQISGSRAVVLFRFSDRPLMLNSVASCGFAQFPQDAVVPLLPKHAYSLGKLHSPLQMDAAKRAEFFSTDGNFNPALLQWIIPLRVKRKLVGLLGLGEHAERANYSEDELRPVELLGHYISLAVYNQSLTETLAARIAENLRLLSSVHTFYDSTIDVLASAIDIKHPAIEGHSRRVGDYASGLAQSLGMADNELAAIRAAGCLHDIGKVAVDSYLFGKSEALNAAEFRQIADHTILGYQIVKDIEFPWEGIPDVVRSHHERVDGTGYPDAIPLGEMRPEVKIVALADTFDAMTSDRPYRRRMSVGEVLMALVNLTPTKFDPESVQALILQVRRDAVAEVSGAPTPNRQRFLHEGVACDLFPSDIDQIAALMNQKLTHGRTHFDLIH